MNNYQRLVLERITVLWRYRQWWRTHRWADWPDLRHDHDVELRALLAIARAARHMPKDYDPERQRAFALSHWTEAEKAEAFGK